MRKSFITNLFLMLLCVFASGCTIVSTAVDIAMIPVAIVGEAAEGVVDLISDDDDDDRYDRDDDDDDDDRYDRDDDDDDDDDDRYDRDDDDDDDDRRKS